MRNFKHSERIRKGSIAGTATILLAGCTTGIDTGFSRNWPQGTYAAAPAPISPAPVTAPSNSGNMTISTPTLSPSDYVKSSADVNTLASLVLQDRFNCGEVVYQWNPRLPIRPEFYPQQFQFSPHLLATLRDFRRDDNSGTGALKAFVQEQNNLRARNEDVNDLQDLASRLHNPIANQRGYIADCVWTLIDRTGVVYPAPGKVQAHTHLLDASGALRMSNQDRSSQDFVIAYDHGNIRIADKAGNVAQGSVTDLQLRFWLDVKTAETLAMHSTLQQSNGQESMKYLNAAANSHLAAANKQALTSAIKSMYTRYLNRIAASEGAFREQSVDIFNNLISDLRLLNTNKGLGLELTDRMDTHLPPFDSSTVAERDPHVFYTIKGINPVSVQSKLIPSEAYPNAAFVHQDAFPEGTSVPPGLPVPMPQSQPITHVQQVTPIHNSRNYSARGFDDWFFPIVMFGAAAAIAAAIWHRAKFRGSRTNKANGAAAPIPDPRLAALEQARRDGQAAGEAKAWQDGLTNSYNAAFKNGEEAGKKKYSPQ